ncbi:MAG TPA: energy transducer TonB, partial [Terriglobales bacterium]|nr:energy transducer TonB [Terriglobales bacterium]
FSPPADSPGPITRVIGLPSNILMEEYLTSRPAPTFPRGVKGKVTVKFVIGKDGHVIHTEASESSEDLRKAVCENTMKLEFRPFLILDKPAEVEASISYQVQ